MKRGVKPRPDRYREKNGPLRRHGKQPNITRFMELLELKWHSRQAVRLVGALFHCHSPRLLMCGIHGQTVRGGSQLRSIACRVEATYRQPVPASVTDWI